MAQYKNIDIVPDETITRVHLSQGDIGRTLIFYLFENALSWSVPASSTIKCQGTKPSGFGFSVSCTYSGNTVTCVTTEEMTDEFGQIEAELVITSSDESQIFGTSNFILDIEKNPHPASTEDGNAETAIALTARITALESAVGDIDDLETEADDLVGAINEIASGSGGSGGSGLTDDIKQALLQLASKVAYIDDDGQDYYDALEDALYPPANLVSISAVYTQSGTVYDNATLDSLKTDLVVTAHYDDSSSSVVTTYTLSGTLTAGTSTITVAYGGKTTTFTVTVTHATTQYTITNTLTNCTNSNNASVINELTSYSGTLTATSGNVMSTVAITMGGTDITSTAYNSETGAISIASVTGNVVITAEAVEDVGWVSGVPYDMTDGLTENKYLNNGAEATYNGWSISPYLPCRGAFILSDTAFEQYVGEYDANGSYVRKDNVNANLYYNYDEYDIASIRVSEATSKVENAVITPYRFPTLTESTVYATNTYYTASWTNGGYINTTTGEVVSQNGSRYTDFLNCYGATKITDNIRLVWRSYSFYDGNKEYLSTVDIASAEGTNGKETTVPSGARYFRISKTYPSLGLCFKLD